jgi:hypothetical protein
MGNELTVGNDAGNRTQAGEEPLANDAFHPPVTRTFKGQTRHMVWDGWRLAEERDADNSLVVRYVHGQGPDEMISKTGAQGATLYCHHDGAGNEVTARKPIKTAIEAVEKAANTDVDSIVQWMIDKMEKNTPKK